MANEASYACKLKTLSAPKSWSIDYLCLGCFLFLFFSFFYSTLKIINMQFFFFSTLAHVIITPHSEGKGGHDPFLVRTNQPWMHVFLHGF